MAATAAKIDRRRLQIIAFNRTAATTPGKTANAIEFAHETAAYVKTTYSIDLKVLSPIGGNPYKHIAWSTRYGPRCA